MPSPKIEGDLINEVHICLSNSIKFDNREYGFGKKSPRTPKSDRKQTDQ